MVPNLSKGAGIKGTALYVLHDERDEGEKALGWELASEYQTAKRVGFTATRNLSTDDPELAWRLMCQTAKQQDQLKAAAGVHKGGRRTEKFCGHLSLSWEHGATPDATEMQRAAEGALTALGWEKLQALIVEHRDHEHAHCHIVVNLIDPETGKAAPNAKNDYEKLQEWAHGYELERGKIVCDRRAERIEAGKAEREQPERRQWLPRKEWEAQQQAKREAAHAAQQAQRSSRAVQQTEARQQIKEAAAAIREQFRPEWAELYKAQRSETRNLDQRQAEQAQQLARAITNPAERAAFYNRYHGELWRANEGKEFATTAALLSPTNLTEAVNRVQAAQRAELETRQAAAKAEIAGRMEAARHDAQREIFRAQRERQQLQPQREQQTPANQNPQPERSKSAAERELDRYAAQREARGRSEAAAKAEQARKDSRRDEERREDDRTDATRANRPGARSPANANDPNRDRAQRLANMLERMQREQERQRARELER